MIANLLQKVLVSTTVGTIIGFSTILGAMSSASALTVESESFNRNGNQQDISHIAFFIKDDSGNVTKVKIDGVSGGAKSYDATNFLNTYYPDSEVVAYQVKASNKKSFVSLDENYSEDNLPTKQNSADKTYQYSSVSNLPAPEPQQPEDTTPEVEDVIIPPTPVVTPTLPTPPTITIPPSNQTKPPAKAVAVPEPGSLAAIAIFGLGGLLGKKKKSS